MSREDLQSLLGRVTTDGIVETAVKESVDFIVRLGERPDVGRNIYKQVFPKSKDKAKETLRGEGNHKKKNPNDTHSPKSLARRYLNRLTMRTKI